MPITLDGSSLTIEKVVAIARLCANRHSLAIATTFSIVRDEPSRVMGMVSP